MRAHPGQAAVELALTLMTLLLIVAGVLDLGRAFYAYISITNAAREGARAGVNAPTESATIMNRVNQELAAQGITPKSITISCSPHTCASALNGDRVEVAITYDFGLVTTGLLPIGRTITLANSASMPIMNLLQ